MLLNIEEALPRGFRFPTLQFGNVADLLTGPPARWGGVVALSSALFIYSYATLANPKSMGRLLFEGYVESLNADFRVLYEKERGRAVAIGQALFVAAGMAAAVVRFDVKLVVAAVVAAIFPAKIIRVLVTKRRAKLDEQLHGFALNLANALRTTANIGDALRMTISVTSAPLSQDLTVMMKHVGLGTALDDALLQVAERLRIAGLDVLVSALLIGRRTGGDVPWLLEKTAGSLREMKRIDAYASKLLLQPKIAFYCAAACVGGAGVYCTKAMPLIFGPLLHTAEGRAFIGTFAALFVACLIVGYSITKVKV